jgi:hypothetical protein
MGDKLDLPALEVGAGTQFGTEGVDKGLKLDRILVRRR